MSFAQIPRGKNARRLLSNTDNYTKWIIIVKKWLFVRHVYIQIDTYGERVAGKKYKRTSATAIIMKASTQAYNYSAAVDIPACYGYIIKLPHTLLSTQK